MGLLRHGGGSKPAAPVVTGDKKIATADQMRPTKLVEGSVPPVFSGAMHTEYVPSMSEQPYTTLINTTQRDLKSQAPFTMAQAVAGKNKGELTTLLQDPSFDHFVKNAYHEKDGYSIRLNPLTGEKEMMVAGTRDAGQWGLNLLDTVTYNADRALAGAVNVGIKAGLEARGIDGPAAEAAAGFISPKKINAFKKLDVWRDRKTRYYEKIAKDNGIDVIYGHSRGGAMVADMRLPGVTKVGLDAAMNEAGNQSMLNLNEEGGNPLTSWFDYGIGLGGKNNIGLDQSPGLMDYHKVWKT